MQNKTVGSLKKAFTLIELLIVVAILAIVAGVVIVALNPATRFQDARDARRLSDVEAILSAVKLNQIDNGGTYNAAISGLTADTDYMIMDGAGCSTEAPTSCNAPPACDVTIAAASGVDLSFLRTTGYLGSIPQSPSATAGTWDATETGYYIRRSGAAGGALIVGACESENTTSISASR